MPSSPLLATLFLMVLLVAIVVAALSSPPGSYIAHAPRDLPPSLWIMR